MAALGGLVVVGAWVLMMLGPGWVLLPDQAVAVAAATSVVVLVWLRRSGSAPLGDRAARTALAALAVLTFFLAMNAVPEAFGDWDFIVEFGGPTMYLPFLAYLAGAVVLTVGGVMIALSLRSPTTPQSEGHASQ